MRVLVTGASGFVGSTLCDELSRRGHELKVLMRSTSKTRNLGRARVTPVQGDLRDARSLENAVKDVDVIFHVAGVVTAKNLEDFLESNEGGTRNLAEAALRFNPELRRFLYVSSLAAAGPAEPGGSRREDETENPVSWYGESKLAGELVLREMGKELPSVVVRPPAVYGPRDRGIYTFFDAVSKGVLPLLGLENPDPRRYSFVHVDDLVQGIVLAGMSERKFSPAEVFYVSGDEEYSWEQSMRWIAEGLEKKPVDLRLPLPLMYGAAALCTGVTKLTGKLMPLSLDKMKELKALAWTCDNGKVKRDLGFRPYWALKDGLRQTARWYRENGWIS